MRRPVVHYRDMPRFVRRRLNRIPGEINAILIVVVLGLALLDLLYATQKLVDGLPLVLRMNLHDP